MSVLSKVNNTKGVKTNPSQIQNKAAKHYHGLSQAVCRNVQLKAKIWSQFHVHDQIPGNWFGVQWEINSKAHKEIHPQMKQRKWNNPVRDWCHQVEWTKLNSKRSTYLSHHARITAHKPKLMIRYGKEINSTMASSTTLQWMCFTVMW